MSECKCVSYNELKGDWETSPECWGDCQSETADNVFLVLSEKGSKNVG